MTTENNELGPAINDQFWFDTSKQLLNNSSTAINESAKTLQTFIKWLLTVYTGTATLSSILSESGRTIWVIISIIVTFTLYILSYWLAVRVEMPVYAPFDSRIPEDIKRAFTEAVTIKRKRLNIAIVFSLVASLSVATTIALDSWGKSNKNIESITNYDFKVSYNKINDNYSIGLSGYFPKSTAIKIKVIRNSVTIDTIKYITDLTSTNDGIVQTSFLVNANLNIDSSSIVTEWIEKDKPTKCMVKKIKN